MRASKARSRGRARPLPGATGRWATTRGPRRLHRRRSRAGRGGPRGERRRPRRGELEAGQSRVTEYGGEATATVRMTWAVPEIGEFEYTNDRVRLTESGDEWLIELERAGRAPRARGRRAARHRRRRPSRERRSWTATGASSCRCSPVVDVGVVPEELDDPEAAVARSPSSPRPTPKTFQKSIEAAPIPENFVPAITLRQEDFAPIEQELSAVPGIQFAERETPLAPTRDFARGAARHGRARSTAEQIEESDGELDVDDVVGQCGLSGGVRGAARRRAGALGRDQRTPTASRSRRCETRRGRSRASRSRRRSTLKCRAPPRRRSPTSRARRRWSRSSPRPATSSRSPTGPTDEGSTARSPASTRRARPSR